MVEDRPHGVFPQRVVSRDIKELLHSLWAFSPQVVYQSLTRGSRDEGTGNVSVG
jgi:hypothetical protein